MKPISYVRLLKLCFKNTTVEWSAAHPRSARRVVIGLFHRGAPRNGSGKVWSPD
jgi:hypothetical protein